MATQTTGEVAEISGPQLASSQGFVSAVSMGALMKVLPASYATYREMRKHPTIALVRAMNIAAVVASEWSVESDDDAPDDRVEMIRDTMLPQREPLVEAAMANGIDFGWSAFEQVYSLNRQGQQIIGKHKALIPDITDIMVQQTGTFAGFAQTNPIIELPVENSLNISFRVEGTDWYGQGLLENVRDIYNAWVEVNDKAKLYDKKIAGSYWMIHYPVGTTPIDGTEVNNAKIARDFVDALTSSAALLIPTSLAAQYSDLEKANSAWKVELISDAGARQPSFTIRLEYFDKLFVRGLLWPERAMLEGKFGTKADAGQHTDLALTNSDLQHRTITRHVNWHSVDRMLALNWGEEARGTVRLVAAPLVNAQLTFLRELYLALLKNPTGFLEEFDVINRQALRETVGVTDVDEREQDAARERRKTNNPELDPDGLDQPTTEEEAAFALTLTRSLKQLRQAK